MLSETFLPSHCKEFVDLPYPEAERKRGIYSTRDFYTIYADNRDFSADLQTIAKLQHPENASSNHS